MTSYRKGPLDPDRFQMRDIKRRISQLEKQRGRDYDRIERLAKEVLMLKTILGRLLPPLPPPGEATQ